MILITDGEDHEGDVQGGRSAPPTQGVKIYTVGIGTARAS